MDYEKTDQIMDSWINGQKDQAYRQYRSSGFDPFGLLHECRHSEEENTLLNMFAFFLAVEERKNDGI